MLRSFFSINRYKSFLLPGQKLPKMSNIFLSIRPKIYKKKRYNHFSHKLGFDKKPVYMKKYIQPSFFWHFRHLNLSYNLLQDISRSGFYGLDTLETLDLSFNDLRSIDASLFDNQKWLVDLKVIFNYRNKESDYMHVFQNYLTHLTWLIHTSFLPSKWNLYPKIQFLS